MELNGIQDSLERVAKRRKLLSSKSEELIDQVTHEIEQALASIRSNNDSDVSVDQKTVLTGLKSNLQVVDSRNFFEGSQRELNMDLCNHGKVLEETLYPDISKASQNVDFDTHTLNQIIISHFYRERLFNIVDCLTEEASECEPISLGLLFHEILQILEAVKSRNLKPALKWVFENKERLKESGPRIELKLHKQHFVDILQSQSRADALEYAKTYLAPLASYHMNEIQRLMGSLLWAGKLEKSPYADLLDPIHWKKLPDEVMQALCNFSGQPFRDPLNVVVAAGVEALLTLLKWIDEYKNHWQAMEELPVEIELGREFLFHSIIVCPVSLDRSSEENPPMLLSCGHVLCKQSIDRLAEENTLIFRCPFCLRDASAAECKQLHF